MFEVAGSRRDKAPQRCEECNRLIYVSDLGSPASVHFAVFVEWRLRLAVAEAQSRLLWHA